MVLTKRIVLCIASLTESSLGHPPDVFAARRVDLAAARTGRLIEVHPHAPPASLIHTYEVDSWDKLKMGQDSLDSSKTSGAVLASGRQAQTRILLNNH